MMETGRKEKLGNIDGERGTVGGRNEGFWWKKRAEIDTSTPFDSVKEAVDHFGGSGLRKQNQHPEKKSSSSHLKSDDTSNTYENDHLMEEVIANVEEQSGQLREDLIVKERETLEVLKELEMTKKFLDGLKTKLQKESSKHFLIPEVKASEVVPPSEEKSGVNKVVPRSTDSKGRIHSCSSDADSSVGKKPSPGSILMELKQAKFNLNRFDLAGLRSSTAVLKNEIEKEKLSMEKTRGNIASNSSRISSLEKELNQTRTILQMAKDPEFKNGLVNSPLVARKFHELRSETEQFKRMAAKSESEALKRTEEIAKFKAGIKTAEVRLLAAQKVEEAAKATVESTLSDLKVQSCSKVSGVEIQNLSGVTLSVEDYNLLIEKANDSETISKQKIEHVMSQVDEANNSRMELSKKVEEADAEIKNSRKALTEALHRVDEANKAKLAVEEALRKWRSEHGQKRRSSVNSSPRFKNPLPGHHRRDLKSLDNCSTLITDSKNLLKPSLSIGQILSEKLTGPEELEETLTKDSIKEREKLSSSLSLGQMLNRRHGISSPESNGDTTAPRKSFQAKRKNKKKKLGFVGSFSLILVNQNKMNKNKRKETTRETQNIPQME